jgi:hypothetical protein
MGGAGATALRSFCRLNRFAWRHRIIAAAAPGMAARQPPQRKTAAAQRTMFRQRFDCVIRTARQIPTGRRQYRRYQQLISADNASQRRARNGREFERLHLTPFVPRVWGATRHLARPAAARSRGRREGPRKAARRWFRGRSARNPSPASPHPTKSAPLQRATDAWPDCAPPHCRLCGWQ